MATLMLAVPNFIDAEYGATFSGGSWLAAHPLTNLRDRRLSRVARSTNAALTSTKFEVDLKSSRMVKVVAIPKHNLSMAAKYRITASDSTPVTGSGSWIDVFAEIYPTGVLPTGHPSYATRKLTTQEFAAGYNIGLTFVIPAGNTKRYWLIEIDDTTNAAGYVDLARLVIAFAYQPTYNTIVGGTSIGYEDASTFTESPGGARFYDEQGRRRVMRFTIPNLTVDEALAFGLDVQRKYGTTGQIFAVFNPSDTEHMHRRAFLGVMRQLSLLEYPFTDRMSVPLAFTEEM